MISPILSNLSHHSLFTQQAIANRGSIESLIPRVEQLAVSLSTPAPEGEGEEIKRRQKLKE